MGGEFWKFLFRRGEPVSVSPHFILGHRQSPILAKYFNFSPKATDFCVTCHQKCYYCIQIRATCRGTELTPNLTGAVTISIDFHFKTSAYVYTAAR